jgi:hypothetical protein
MTNVFVNAIRGSQGKFFSVTFVKQDGKTRVLNGRIHGSSPCGNYLVVYDVQNHGFRNVNVNTIQSLRLFGVEIRKV